MTLFLYCHSQTLSFNMSCQRRYNYVAKCLKPSSSAHSYSDKANSLSWEIINNPLWSLRFQTFIPKAKSQWLMRQNTKIDIHRNPRNLQLWINISKTPWYWTVPRWDQLAITLSYFPFIACIWYSFDICIYKARSSTYIWTEFKIILINGGSKSQ